MSTHPAQFEDTAHSVDQTDGHDNTGHDIGQTLSTVEAGHEGERETCEDAGPEQRQRHPPEAEEAPCGEIHRGLLEARIHALQPCLDGQEREGNADGSMRRDLRREAQFDAGGGEEDDGRHRHHDFGQDDYALGPHHPAPHRHRAGWVLAFALGAAPTAWLIQTSVNYGVASPACYPAAEPLGEMLSRWPWPAVLAVNLLGIAIAAAAAFTGYRTWRRTRHEADGDAGSTLEAGEGRTRFLSLWNAGKYRLRHRPALQSDRHIRCTAMRISLTALACLALLSLGTSPAHAQPPFGDPQRGASLIAQIDCGSCHIIPGIRGARDLVGPPLNHMSRRIYIAGLLHNTPENMVRWLMHPQNVVRGNAMTEMGLTAAQAQDIAAYLDTLE